MVLAVISYFSLSCVFACVSAIALIRTCKMCYLMNDIMKWFYALICVFSFVRCASYISMTSILASNPAYVIFNSTDRAFTYEEILRIDDKNKAEAIGSWLPVEVTPNQGVNRVHVGLFTCALLPQLFYLTCFTLLVWQMLSDFF